MTHTKVKLYTGGKSQSNRRNLFRIACLASAYGEPSFDISSTDFPWHLVQAGPVIHNEDLKCGGLTVGKDGILWHVFPDNSEQDLTITAPAKHYDANASPTKHRLHIAANGTPLADNRVVPSAEFCVGQKIDLLAYFTPTINDTYTESCHWNLQQEFVNAWEQANWEASLNFYIESWPLSMNPTYAWWVDDGGVKDVRYSADLTFGNGQRAFLTQSGQIRLYKPQIDPFKDLPPHFISLDSSRGSLFLELGVDGGQGTMQWRIGLIKIKNFTGYMFHTQTIKRDVLKAGSSPSSTGGQFWLDNSVDYINGNQFLIHSFDWAFFLDGPGIPCDSGYVDVVEDFKAFFRFLPDPMETSIPVTVGITTWGWSARAEETGGIWSLTRSNVTYPTFTPSTQMPRWENTFHDP